MSENFVSNSNATSLITKVGKRLELRPKTWTGSHDEWDALTPVQQAEYDYVNFNDDMTDDYIQIDWNEWENMSESERAQIKRGTVVNVPGLDAGIKVELFKLLWSNPNPTSAFAAQNITLASDEYDFLLWIMKSWSTGSVQSSTIITKGSNGYLNVSIADSSKIIIVRRRAVTYVDNRTYSIEAGYGANTTDNTYTTDNNICVPIAVYGIKKSIDVTINTLGCEVFPQPRLFRLENYTLPTPLSIGQFASAAVDTGKTLSQLTNGYLGNRDKKRTVIQLLYTANSPMNLVNSYIGNNDHLYLELFNGFSNAQYITKIWLLVIAFPEELVKSIT